MPLVAGELVARLVPPGPQALPVRLAGSARLVPLVQVLPEH